MIDCHVHSSFSGDSEMPAEVACERAIEVGLKGLTFTDHLDIDFPDFSTEFLIDFDKYSVFMDNLKDKYKNRLKVLKGIEIGIQPHVMDETDKTVSSQNFDFVLCSVHVIDRIDPYQPIYYKGKTKQQAYSKYLQAILFTVTNFNNFDAAGHFDYVIRKACYDDRSLRYCDHTELMDSILKTLVSKSKGFEINTGSYRDLPGKTTAEYDIGILKRYKELGGKIVTLGSDSHVPDYIGYKFNYFKDMLKEAGFSYITHFEARKPVFDRI